MRCGSIPTGWAPSRWTQPCSDARGVSPSRTESGSSAIWQITMVSGVLQVLPALVIRQIVDQALPRRSATQVAVLAAELGLICIANSALHVVAAWSGTRIGSGI